jgi:hypothetical protein
MAIVPRSEIVQPGNSVQLMALFRGPDGQPTDLDAFPMVTIVQPSGGIAIGPTSAGVFHNAVGQYGFVYAIGLQPAVGTWKDVWMGTLNGFSVTGEFNFTVFTSELPAINSDGYVHLGDDPGFNYSQNAIKNINNLLKVLKARLKSSGKHKTKDQFGNVIFEDCDIFTTDQLVTFLAMSLYEFNEVPHFTLFTFEDTPIIENFGGILVQGATLMALSSQALIERGREFQINDNGIGFTPPTISEMLNTQWTTELNNWYDRLKMIKHNMKPAPYGLGTMRTMGVAPQVLRLRHLRQRQIL